MHVRKRAGLAAIAVTGYEGEPRTSGGDIGGRWLPCPPPSTMQARLQARSFFFAPAGRSSRRLLARPLHFRRGGSPAGCSRARAASEGGATGSESGVHR